MISSTKINAKRFILNYLFAFFSLALIFPFLCMAFIDLGGEEIVKFWYRAKNNIIKSLSSEPILYVVGGSSAFWGIDAELLESQLPIFVVNYGVHAGLGLEYQLKQIEKRLKLGDKVLLAFEASLLGSKSEKLNEFIRSYVYTYDPLYLFNFGLKRFASEIYSISKNDLQESIWNWTIKGRNKFCEPKAKLIQHMKFGKRGDREFDSPNKRPLESVTLFKISKNGGFVLSNFIKKAKENNIEIFFTWQPTVIRNDGLTAYEIEAIKEIKNFFREHDVPVLNEPTDHLFPLCFFRDTPLHLSQAGKSIRTEKILNDLRTHFTFEDSREPARDILLMAEDNHDIRFDRKLSAGRMIKKVFCNHGKMGSEHVIGIEGIKKHLRDGYDIFFSDAYLLSEMIENDLGISIRDEYKRQYANDFKIYANHIFFIVSNCETNIESYDRNCETNIESYDKTSLDNANLCVMIIGTGKFRNIHICKCSSDLSHIELKRNEKLGNYSNNWDIVLEASQKDGATIKFDKVEFFPNQKKQKGIRVIILDPVSEIILDQFFYFGFSEHIDNRLYQLGLFPDLDTLPLNALHLTGGSAPKTFLADEGLKILFTGKNSFVGWRVESNKTGYHFLILDVKKCGDGNVFAGYQGNSKFGIVSTPARREVRNRCRWERIVIGLETNQYFGKDGGYAYLGLWANKNGVAIEIKNPRLYFIKHNF